MGYPTQWEFDEMDRAECARDDRLAEIRARFGKARVAGCQCEYNFTCRHCLNTKPLEPGQESSK